MDREQLRQKLLAKADKLRNSAVWRFMTPEDRQFSLAGRQFWSEDTPVTNAALDRLGVILASSERELAAPVDQAPTPAEIIAAVSMEIEMQTRWLNMLMEALKKLQPDTAGTKALAPQQAHSVTAIDILREAHSQVQTVVRWLQATGTFLGDALTQFPQP